MRFLKFEDSKDRVVFLIGCFSTLYVSILGRVYVGELIVFLIYLFKPGIRNTKLPQHVKTLKNLLWVWLLSALLSDLYRQTPFIDSMKGVVSILFLIVLLPFAYWSLYDKIERWYYFVIGSIISSQLTYYLLTATTEFGSTEIWKIYSFVPIFSGIAGILYNKGHFTFSYLVFILFGIWALYNGSRNAFLTCCITVVILAYINRFQSGNVVHELRQYKNRIFTLLISLSLGLMVINFSYDSLASGGYLGQKAYEKYYAQKNSKQGIASGRLEAIIAATLISESPIIGYGSFAKDRRNYVYNFMRKNNYEIKPGRFNVEEDSVENMLPRHSRIFGTWMWHGIGCGLFWIYILILFYRVLQSGCLLLYPQLLGFSIYTLCSEIWDTFFSIMSIRLVPLFFWVFIILIYNKYKSLKT